MPRPHPPPRVTPCASGSRRGSGHRTSTAARGSRSSTSWRRCGRCRRDPRSTSTASADRATTRRRHAVPPGSAERQRGAAGRRRRRRDRGRRWPTPTSCTPTPGTPTPPGCFASPRARRPARRHRALPRAAPAVEGRPARRRLPAVVLGGADGVPRRATRSSRSATGCGPTSSTPIPSWTRRGCTSSATASTPRPTGRSTAPDVVRGLGVDPDRPYALFVGRITRQKGVMPPAGRRRAAAAGGPAWSSAPAPPTPRASGSRWPTRSRSCRPGAAASSGSRRCCPARSWCR